MNSWLLESLELTRRQLVTSSSNSHQVDQYSASLPQILERLVDALRSAQADGAMVHHTVLLCFRILLLRVSPRSLASFWSPPA